VFLFPTAGVCLAVPLGVFVMLLLCFCCSCLVFLFPTAELCLAVPLLQQMCRAVLCVFFAVGVVVFVGVLSLI
jgi:hypothetical protein